MKRLKIRTIFADQYGTYSFDVDLKTIHGSIIEQRHRMFGRCYTYQPEEAIRKLGIYYINAEL